MLRIKPAKNTPLFTNINDITKHAISDIKVKHKKPTKNKVNILTNTNNIFNNAEINL